MRRKPTQADVAEVAGVSCTTVSYVISGRADVTIPEKTRRRVLQAAGQLGYSPNATARALATGRTQQVTLWANFAYTSYYARVGQFAQEEAARRRYQLLIRDFHQDLPLLGQIDPTTWLTDGILCVDVWFLPRLQKDRQVRIDKPIVFMGSFSDPEKDYVGVDLYQGAVAAVQHLLQAQPRRLAGLLAGEPDPRWNAYLRVMREAGRQPELIPMPDETRQGNRQRLKAYIQEKGCPDALFCHNDNVAIAAYRALCDLGIRVPEDVAIVGCDGIEETEYHACPISTIAQPVQEMCALAWQQLERRMRDPSAPLQKVMLPPRLVIRQSSCR
jgi:LacI family transcriptional regulator